MHRVTVSTRIIAQAIKSSAAKDGVLMLHFTTEALHVNAGNHSKCHQVTIPSDSFVNFASPTEATFFVQAKTIGSFLKICKGEVVELAFGSKLAVSFGDEAHCLQTLNVPFLSIDNDWMQPALKSSFDNLSLSAQTIHYLFSRLHYDSKLCIVGTLSIAKEGNTLFMQASIPGLETAVVRCEDALSVLPDFRCQYDYDICKAIASSTSSNKSIIRYPSEECAFREIQTIDDQLMLVEMAYVAYS